VSAKPAEATAAATPAADGKPFVVQIGVFSSSVNAEALREKLHQAGIPAYTETRLQVGPFKDRTEAERTLQRLKELGVKGVVVPQR
jgi:DedD protein